jgi:DNA-binding winged helix-turn-helix (wHTH) protein/TolB-like protein
MRFGIFEYQPDTGELYREGVQVRLQAQPAQVLGLLLRHAGQIVTRAQLKETVWGSETFVDFDKGLNFCIAQVRAALSDSADAPIYIRTVPKQGYQFIAPITSVGDLVSSDQNAPLVGRLPAFALLHSTGFRLSSMAALIILSGALIFWARQMQHVRQHTMALAQETRVVVTRFDNETGDPQFDRFADALSDSVTAKLTTSGGDRYGVIGNAAILRVPRSQRDLTAIGSSLNARYVILAQVRSDSSHFFVLAHLIHLPEQTHIAVTELTCAAGYSLQQQSEIAQQIADKFSPLIARLDASPTHKAM